MLYAGIAAGSRLRDAALGPFQLAMKDIESLPAEQRMFTLAANAGAIFPADSDNGLMALGLLIDAANDAYTRPHRGVSIRKCCAVTAPRRRWAATVHWSCLTGGGFARSWTPDSTATISPCACRARALQLAGGASGGPLGRSGAPGGDPCRSARRGSHGGRAECARGGALDRRQVRALVYPDSQEEGPSSACLFSPSACSHSRLPRLRPRCASAAPPGFRRVW